MKGLIFVAFCAGASVYGSAALAAGSFEPTGGRTTQPVGHWEFCQTYPDECEAGRATGPVKLTREAWKSIVAVNNAVNASVQPRTDFEMWGREEFWSYPDGFGDCEDYALEKRRELIALGVPVSALLMTVVRQPNGDGHAVLTVRTDRGDFILDNLEPQVLRWSDTPYTFLKRQSERSPGAWVSIEDGRATPVGSVQ